MPEATYTAHQLRPALEAYGIGGAAVEFVASGGFAEVYRIHGADLPLLLRIRAPEAGPDEIRFAHLWAAAVAPDVPAPQGLPPDGDVPRIDHRCAEVITFINHDPDGGGAAGPDAWEQVGRCLYAAGRPVGVLDLDFLQRGLLLHDLAYASHWLVEWEMRGGAWQGITGRYVAAYEAGRDRPLTDDERICLPWLRVLSNLYFFVSKVCQSWRRLALALDDLEGAEAVAARGCRRADASVSGRDGLAARPNAAPPRPKGGSRLRHSAASQCMAPFGCMRM